MAKSIRNSYHFSFSFLARVSCLSVLSSSTNNCSFSTLLGKVYLLFALVHHSLDSYSFFNNLEAPPFQRNRVLDDSHILVFHKSFEKKKRYKFLFTHRSQLISKSVCNFNVISIIFTQIFSTPSIFVEIKMHCH